jgi:hypothetical protein
MTSSTTDRRAIALISRNSRELASGRSVRRRRPLPTATARLKIETGRTLDLVAVMRNGVCASPTILAARRHIAMVMRMLRTTISAIINYALERSCTVRLELSCVVIESIEALSSHDRSDGDGDTSDPDSSASPATLG